jgi:hypothetical protein
MFDGVPESFPSRLKRWTIFLSILYLGLALAELIKYWYTRQVDHGLMAAVWLATAVAWACRFRHFGEPQLTKLDIDEKTQD